MPNPKVPPSAAPDVQAAIRELWAEIDRLNGSRNVDWHGRRIINAGEAVDPGDYVTLGQLSDEVIPIAKKVVSDMRPIGNSGSGSGGSSGGGSGASVGATYATIDDETTPLPNSRQLVAGSNITFDISTPGEITIASVPPGGGGADYVVLSDGNPADPQPVNDGAGNFIYVAYTP